MGGHTISRPEILDANRGGTILNLLVNLKVLLLVLAPFAAIQRQKTTSEHHPAALALAHLQEAR